MEGRLYPELKAGCVVVTSDNYIIKVTSEDEYVLRRKDGCPIDNMTEVNEVLNELSDTIAIQNTLSWQVAPGVRQDINLVFIRPEDCTYIQILSGKKAIEFRKSEQRKNRKGLMKLLGLLGF